MHRFGLHTVWSDWYECDLSYHSETRLFFKAKKRKWPRFLAFRVVFTKLAWLLLSSFGSEANR